MRSDRSIRTRRLLLKPLTEAETDALHRLFTDPDVRRYLLDDTVIPRSQAVEFIQKSLHLFESTGYGLWGAYPPSGGALMGMGGFWHFHEPPQLELIYALHPSRWGRGLATELARALIRYGFEELGFERIQASTDTPNKASARVMEKAGMTFEERKTEAGRETVFYSIQR
jgi:ribosomal-protein-alanine N-acetyltransferase